MMELELEAAARSGDICFLIDAIATKPTDYFLSQCKGSNHNILHIAMWENKEKFFKEAIERLPKEFIRVLLTQPDYYDDDNPLHLAAKHNNIESIRLIHGFYKSYTLRPSLSSSPSFVNTDLHRRLPWLTLNRSKETPLHCSLKFNNDECAMEILSMDMELLCTMVDEYGDTPLFLAVREKCNRVADRIFMFYSSDSLSGEHGSGATPLHIPPHSSADKVQGMEDDGHSRDENNGDDDSVAVPTSGSKSVEFERKHVWGELRAATTSKSLDCPLWKRQNIHGDTLLHVVLSSLGSEEMALRLLSIDPSLCQIFNNRGESPLFLAVEYKFGRVVEEILEMHQQDIPFSMLHRNDGKTLLHVLSYPENIGKRLLEKYWWMMNSPDDSGSTALDDAKYNNIPWLVNYLTNPSLIQMEPFDWITACQSPTETFAILAFIHSCYDLQAVCREKNDTPLHHIRLQTYSEYVKFLKIPSITELKNETDFEGATPLHRALERKDMHLAKILLLDNGVERNIKDDRGYTAMDLLAKLCKDNDDWAKMCKQMKVNPYLRTSYIQPGTNLGEMRNTLSVVAALLATITFAAGFTLPGGLNQETGDAILAKKAAFLVFLLSDAYAMCTSMLVLFCLIWSMISTREMSYFLVDRSVLILMQALYGTMVAFMTGIYVVIARSSLWAAIVIFIMCLMIGISANRTVLHKTLARFIPTTYPERGSRTNNEKSDLRLLEEGKAFGSGDDSRKVV